MIDSETILALFRINETALFMHSLTAGLYILLDKYDCAEFRSECLESLCGWARLCLDRHWSASDFWNQHYSTIADEQGGDYPQELYPLLAEAWIMSATADQACPELNALVENNHAVTLFVANAFRARLSRALDGLAATKKSIEALT